MNSRSQSMRKRERKSASTSCPLCGKYWPPIGLEDAFSCCLSPSLLAPNSAHQMVTTWLCWVSCWLKMEKTSFRLLKSTITATTAATTTTTTTITSTTVSTAATWPRSLSSFSSWITASASSWPAMTWCRFQSTSSKNFLRRFLKIDSFAVSFFCFKLGSCWISFSKQKYLFLVSRRSHL